ncbi:MAG: ABC transporter ATP-binding protein, partial [Chitinophagales bacterium]
MNTNNDIAIRVKNISKKYFKKTATGNSEEFYALKNVSFEVKKGEVLGIIGTNGSGKSTLLKILSGVTKPTEGQVEINGTVASILDVGTGFHPDLSGRENVYLRGELLGMTTKEIDSVFHDIVEFSGVEEFIETSVKHYSSGMFLRLAFSIMIHLKSDIMLLDEVMSVGDAAFRNKTMEYLNANSLSQNRTILLISHSFQEIMNNSSQVIELSSGKIAQQGLPEKLLSYYQKNNQ